MQADGKDLTVPGGHAAPVIVDWDQDGRWDIVCGCNKGSVYWYRNVGTPSAPRFAAPVTLLSEHQGTGFDEFRDIDQEAVPGIRSQIAAVDYDGDGRTDLLLGDFCLTLTPRPGLSAGQLRGNVLAPQAKGRDRKRSQSEIHGFARRIQTKVSGRRRFQQTRGRRVDPGVSRDAREQGLQKPRI